MALISVSVLAYNTGEYLLPCLQSVAAQTHTDLDVILVDNGSTDGSGNVCDAFAASDNRFRVFHQENLGSTGGRLRALQEAKGEYIAFVDGDDLLHPDMLRQLLAACQASALPVAACCILPFAGKAPAAKNADVQPKIFAAPQHLSALLHNAQVSYNLGNKLFNTALLRTISFDCAIAYNEDLLANWQVLRNVEGMAFAAFDGYFYRQHGDSVSHKRLAPKSISDQLFVAETIRNDAQDTALATCANAFYYEKVLYLDSMILRQDHAAELADQQRTLTQIACKHFGAALKNPQLSAKMKCVALLACYAHPVYKVLCRTLLTDRR